MARGETLRARLAGGALPVDEVLRIGQQLVEALAHAQGVIHRDFKSTNIVLTPEGRAKVLDVGLTKRLTSDVMAESVTGAPTVTQPGTVAVTVACMAPEPLHGQPADARSDVWALGVVVHEMATGALPLPGETGYEVSAAILHQPPLPLLSASLPDFGIQVSFLNQEYERPMRWVRLLASSSPVDCKRECAMRFRRRMRVASQRSAVCPGARARGANVAITSHFGVTRRHRGVTLENETSKVC